MLLSLLSLFLPSNKYAKAYLTDKLNYTCNVHLTNPDGETPMNTYVIGTTVRMEVTFLDETKAQIIPPTVNVKIKSSDGTVTSGIAVNNGNGTFIFNFVTAIAGTHYYRFESTGTYIVAQEGTFQVKKSGVL